MDLNDKVALITGSSSGIGEGIALKFASFGANLVITGRNESRIKTVVKNCENISNKKFIGIKADLLNDKEVEDLVTKTIAEFGKIDVLVNNAGVCVVIPFGSNNYIKSYDRAMNMNVRTVLTLTQLVVPYLEKTKGNVINISSFGSLAPNRHTSAYCMAKCAIDMFTKCLAIELGPKGVRVNSINPGFIRTPAFARTLNENIIELMEKHCKDSYPLGRVGEPEDVAQVAAFLASESASFITGSLLVVDGGSVLSPTSLYMNPKEFIKF